MARKMNPTRKMREPLLTIIGAGITEKYYFRHLKDLCGLKIEVKPKYFGSDTAHDMQKLVEYVLSMGGKAACVFDMDTTRWDNVEKQRKQDLIEQYGKNSDVLLCDSMPSIEYWFLLHFENTNRYMATSREAMNALRKYIPDFDKNTQFLEKDQWVRLLLADKRLAIACERAETFAKNKTADDTISYSELYKLFKLLNTKL